MTQEILILMGVIVLLGITYIVTDPRTNQRIKKDIFQNGKLNRSLDYLLPYYFTIIIFGKILTPHTASFILLLIVGGFITGVFMIRAVNGE